MTAHELELIHADLMTAKTLADSSEGRRDNPYVANMIAYHSIQAIEKSLKALLRDTNTDEELMYSHDMLRLCGEVQLVRPEFAREYEFIYQNARTLYFGNELRYGDNSISMYNAKGLMYNANNLFMNLKDEYIRETGFSKEDIRRIAKEHYSSLRRFNLKRPDLEEREDNTSSDKDMTD